ncbi:MAG: SDR family NAD(P)-dependent oxidoreductase [Planctomycetota bacterium]
MSDKNTLAQQFSNLEVVVTGGTGTLGEAVVTEVLDRGGKCRVPYRNDDDRDRFAHRSDDRIDMVEAADLSDADTVAALYEPFGSSRRLWASIHVAGGFAFATLADTTPDVIQQQLSMNAVTCMLCCRAAVEKMREAGPLTDDIGTGRLVNIAARPALEPRQGAKMSAYTASKAAVAAFTQAIGEEIASDGIWVNAVAPSILDTPANREAMPDASHDEWPSAEAIARTIVDLASPDNRVARGGIVPVYGRC